MRIGPDTLRDFPRIVGPRLCFIGRNLWKVSRVNKHRNQEEDAGNHQIGHLDHAGFVVTVGFKLLRVHCSQLGRSVFNPGKNEHGSQSGRNHCSHGVERLSKIQPALRTLGRPENSHVRVGANLKKGLSRRHDEQGKQKKTIRSNNRCRDKQESSDSTDQQSNENTPFVSDLFHEPAGGQGTQKISAEERNLNKRRLKIREGKRFLQVWDQHIIQVDSDRPQEKEACDQYERQYIAAFCEGSRGMCHAAPLGQCAIQVDVTAVNEEMLPGDVRGLTGEKENDHSRNLLRPRSFFSGWVFRNAPPKLFLRIRKCFGGSLRKSHSEKE